MKIRTIGYAVAAGLALAAGGCAVEKVRQPPATIEQFEQDRARANPYPVGTIVRHNLRRALDPDLGESERVQSLRLIAHLGESDPAADEQLAALLASEDAPDALKQAALELLLRRGRAGLSEYVVRVIPRLRPDSPLKKDVLDWLERNPDPAVLTDVIRLWAAEPSATGPDEPRYRAIVSGRGGAGAWRGVLLAEINRPDSPVCGEALSLLTARTERAKLARAVAAEPARSEALAAMQAFLTHFGYLPATPVELATCRSLFAARREMFPAAGRLVARWRQEDGYEFNVRDFHLVARLAQDPFRRGLGRAELVREIAAALTERRHVARQAVDPAGPYGFSDRFLRHVDSLSMADLWTIRLVDEMFAVTQVRRKMAVLVAHDRADTQSAQGGLVFLGANGKAHATIYPPDRSAGPNDLAYRFTPEALADARDCLCRFVTHFEEESNARRAGPTAEELAAARAGNYRGLVLTTVSAEEFCVHFHTPEGIVISLGTFPFE